MAFQVVLVGSACLASLVGCLPERALSSYSDERGAAPEITRSTATSLPDAGPNAADAGRDGGQDRDAASSVDAAVAPRAALECRAECACEIGALGEFMFCPTAVSHDEAVERCSLAGGSLASVDGAAQNDWLSANMTQLAADDFWLSGTDAEEEGVWRWSDGRVFFDASADGGTLRSYSPWEEGQPNDLNGEDCMRSTGGLWVDLDCSGRVAFVCQG